MIADVAVFALSQVVLFYGFKVSAQYRAVVLVCLHIHRSSADARLYLICLQYILGQMDPTRDRSDDSKRQSADKLGKIGRQASAMKLNQHEGEWFICHCSPVA